jgi:hypothetical protein
VIKILDVADAVAGNIHYAADNISSAVTSAYSVFRQKTYEVHVSFISNSLLKVVEFSRINLISC